MEVSLKRNGWYNKIQSFVLGSAKPELHSLCPFFWLTIFCIVASPVALIVRGIMKISDTLDKNIEKARRERLDELLNSMSLNDVIEMYEGDEKLSLPFILRKYTSVNIFDMWRQRMLDKKGSDYLGTIEEARQAYRKRLQEIKERRKKDQEKREKRIRKSAERARKRKERLKNIWIPIVKWTQVVFNILLTVLIMLLISFLINLVVKHFSLSGTLEFMKVLGILILIGGSSFGITYGIKTYVLYLVEHDKLSNFFKPIIPFFKFIGNVFKSIGKGFMKFFGLFYEYFKANKNDYCPAINWEDDEE